MFATRFLCVRILGHYYSWILQTRKWKTTRDYLSVRAAFTSVSLSLCLYFHGSICNRLFSEEGLWHSHSPVGLSKTWAMAFKEDVFKSQLASLTGICPQRVIRHPQGARVSFPVAKKKKKVARGWKISFKKSPCKMVQAPFWTQSFLVSSKLRWKTLFRAPYHRTWKTRLQGRNTEPGWFQA